MSGKTFSYMNIFICAYDDRDRHKQDLAKQLIRVANPFAHS